ncbi:hypothetical protein Tco_1090145 [Tanacetum coccineum]|uniref:Retroviral polymerase SH3-like domain-containing protein n=1 Tax=Tanacetum coccineum TaxID=301880 RepID=A0ABQ5I5I0_9ASTR
MLNKDSYVPWSSRLIRHAKSKPNGKLLVNSIKNAESTHKQTDDELIDQEAKQMEVDDQAIQTILMGLPEDIYAAVDSVHTTKEIWLRVEQMMKGSTIGAQEKKAKLFNEWEKFKSTEGESIESYYHRFSKLMNDFSREKHFSEKIASNLKFLTISSRNGIDPSLLFIKQRIWNQNGYNAVQNVRNQVVQNAVQNLGVQNVGNQNEIIVVSGIAPSITNQNANQHGNGIVIVARAKGNSNDNNAEEDDLMAATRDIDEIEEVNENCILMANLQQASTLEEQYTEVLEPISEPHQTQQNNNNVTSVDSSVEQSGGTLQQHLATVEETHTHYESLFKNLAVEVEKVNMVNRKLKVTNADLTTALARYKGQEKSFEINKAKFDQLETGYRKSVYQEQCLTKKINALHLSSGKQITTLNDEIANLNNQLSKERSTVSLLQEEKKKLKSDFKIHEDELLDKQIDLEKKIKELDNILVKQCQSIQTMHMLTAKQDSFYHTEQKMALGYPNPHYLKQAQQKQQSLYNGRILLEKHDPPVVYDSKKTLQLAQESHLKMKQLNKEIKLANYAKINKLSKVFVSQKAKSREEVYFSNTSKMASVSKSFSIPNDEYSDDTPRVARKFLNEVKDTLVTLQRVVKHRMNGNITNLSSSTHQEIHTIFKDEIVHLVNQIDARCESNTLDPLSQKLKDENVSLEFLVLKLPAIKETKSSVKINPSKTSRVDNAMLNKPRASVRTTPITASQSHVTSQENVNPNLNVLSSIGIECTAKTRRPQPRSNTKNDRLAIRNAKSEVICAMCKQCLITANHDVCVPNFVNDMNSHGKKQKANVSNIANQMKWKPKVRKPNKVGSKETLASPKPSEPSICRRWSPTERIFDYNGKIIKSSVSKCQSDNSIGRLNLLMFLGTVRFGNDHVAAILGYGDLQWGNILIARVYFVEGLGHNLFSFGQFCDSDLENDREDHGKLSAKGDIGFFIGYSANFCAYRVYNQRTKKIMETMNVTFDELSAMAFKQRISKPGLQGMTSGQISSGLDLTYALSTITSQKSTECDLDLLFEAMYDDYLGGQPSAATRTSLATQAHQVLQTLTATTIIADTTPTPTNSSS